MVKDAHFIRTDNNEEVVFRGGAIPADIDPNSLEITNMTNVDLLANAWKEEFRGNAVLVGVDASLMESEIYRKSLIDQMKLYKEKYGFYIVFSLYSDDGKNLIRIVNERIIKDWENILSDSNFAYWTGKYVDVFEIVAEPSDSSVYDQNLKNACVDVIRRKLHESHGKSKEIFCGFTPGGTQGYASDAVELTGAEQEWTELYSTVDVHPYRLDTWRNGMPVSVQRPDITAYALKLKEKGIILMITEFGWVDWSYEPEWTKKAIRFFEENKISYFLLGVTGGYSSRPLWDGQRTGELFEDYKGQQLSPVGEEYKRIIAPYINQSN